MNENENGCICSKCGVHLTGERNRCPLCGKLVGKVDEEKSLVYPEIPHQFSYNLIFKISTFAAIVCILIINILNFVFIPHLALYIPLTLITICAWLIVNIGYRKRKNIPKNILYLAILSTGVCIWIDHLMGWYHWSVNFVLPIMSGALSIFYFVLALVDRKNSSTYGIYFLLSMIGNVLTTILYFCGVITVPAFAVISVGISIGLLCFQLLFRWRSFSSELFRRFHV